MKQHKGVMMNSKMTKAMLKNLMNTGLSLEEAQYELSLTHPEAIGFFDDCMDEQEVSAPTKISKEIKELFQYDADADADELDVSCLQEDPDSIEEEEEQDLSNPVDAMIDRVIENVAKAPKTKKEKVVKVVKEVKASKVEVPKPVDPDKKENWTTMTRRIFLQENDRSRDHLIDLYLGIGLTLSRAKAHARNNQIDFDSGKYKTWAI